MAQLAWKQRSSVVAWLRNILGLTAAILFLASACWAQIPQEGDTTSTPIPGAGHDYIHAPFETVNPANGSVSIRIPVRMPKGRELTIPFSFAYDSNGVNYLGDTSTGAFAWLAANSVLSQGGWSNTAPVISVQETGYTVPGVPSGEQNCGVLVNYVLQDPAGDRHNLDLSIFGQAGVGKGGDCQKGGNNPAIVTQGGEAPIFATTTSPSMPGYNILFAEPVTVTDADGTVYSFPSADAPGVGSTTTWTPTSITDRNGNEITVHNTTPASGVFSYTDTLDRTLLSDSGFGQSPETVTVSGLTSPYTLTWTTLPTPTFTATITSIGTPTCSTPTHSAQKVVSTITLPNGQHFTLGYDTVYGLLNKITYPTGGYVRYVWGLNSQSEVGQFATSTLQGVGCEAIYDTPAITDRYVSLNGTTEVLHQHFAYVTTWDPTDHSEWDSKSTTVTTTGSCPSSS